MGRNLNHRVEVLFPVENKRLLKRLRDDILANLSGRQSQRPTHAPRRNLQLGPNHHGRSRQPGTLSGVSKKSRARNETVTRVSPSVGNFRGRLPRVASEFVWIYNELGISFMQVSKWGNSLAVRLPAAVVEALDLKEGDEIEISIAGKRDFKVARDRSKERALEQLRQMKWSFPPDFKFNREEISERRG